MSSEPYLLGVLLLHLLQATLNTAPPQHNVPGSGPGVELQRILPAGAGAMEAQPVSCQVAATQAQHVLPIAPPGQHLPCKKLPLVHGQPLLHYWMLQQSLLACVKSRAAM